MKTLKVQHVTHGLSHSIYCPICEMHNPTAIRIVSSAVKRLVPTFGVLSELRKAGFIPLDRLGMTITTTNKWRDAMYYHVNSCIGGDFLNYEKMWQENQRNIAISEDLKSRVREFGSGEELSEKDFALKMGVLNSITTDPSSLFAIAQDQRLTRNDLIAIFQNFLPTIIAKQLQIVNEAQDEYLAGQRAEAPLKEFGSVGKCLELFEQVVGQYGIENVISN